MTQYNGTIFALRKNTVFFGKLGTLGTKAKNNNNNNMLCIVIAGNNGGNNREQSGTIEQ